MADTGAPWNIPYAEPTDLVRDWPDLSEDVADAVAAGLTAAGNAGIGSNVVQTVKTDTFNVSLAAGSTANITGLAATITPTSATSKILVMATISSGLDGNGYGPRFLFSGGNIGDFRGDAASSRPRVAAGIIGNPDTRGSQGLGTVAVSYLDAPDTTSPVTYQAIIRNGGDGTFAVSVNRTNADADNARNARGASSIILVEVAA